MSTGAAIVDSKQHFGPIDLYYGCRDKSLLLYAQEIALMTDYRVLNQAYIALSRQPGKNKVANDLI